MTHLYSPNDFDAEEYYAHTVGIFVNDKLKPQKVVVRVFGVHMICVLCHCISLNKR